MGILALFALPALLSGPVLSPAALALQKDAQADEVEWYPGGLYVALSGGWMDARASAAQLDAALADDGWTTSSTLDDTDFGWKARLGWRFDAPIAVEVGYADLGTVSSTVRATPSDPKAFLRDLAREHPTAGAGPTLATEVFLADTKRLDLALRGGVWFWDSKIDASGPGGSSYAVSRSGTDLFYGVAVLYRLSDRVQLRAEYEQFGVGGDEVGFASLGLQVRLR
jgi:Outer membrane protein beta-barrel domain